MQQQQNIIEKPGTTISMTQSASSIYGQPRDTSVTSDGVNLRAIIHESRWQKIRRRFKWNSRIEYKVNFKAFHFDFDNESYFRVILIQFDFTLFGKNIFVFKYSPIQDLSLN
jgi:hypothetical protein